MSARSVIHDTSGGMSPGSPSERRRHARYPLQVAARLALPGGQTRPCRIEDFGPGGLYLALEETGSEPIIAGSRPLARNDTVVVQFAGEQGPSGWTQPAGRLHSISAPVARVLPDGVGLTFANLDPSSQQAVRQLVALARRPQTRPADLTSIDPASVKPPPAVVGDVMHTTRCLLWLERQMRSTGDPTETLAAIATGQPSMPQVDPRARELIIDALVMLQRSPEFLAPDENEPLALKERLMTTWEAAGLDVTESDAIVVEIVSTLLDAMLDDPLINSQLKRCIRQLAIPVLKVALQDGFFFFANEQHPARQVLNRLGSLEPSIIGDHRWNAVIDPLVGQIIADTGQGGNVDGFVLRESIFSEVLPQLDDILDEQRRLYDETVANVVREHSKQQSLLDSLRAASVAAKTPESEARQTPPPELRRWLRRVGHLQAGDVVYRHVQGSRTEKLSLATVSSDRSKFLFVDATGNKASTMTPQELAMQFRRGALWMLGASKLPIVERGLSRMLNDLHKRTVHRVNLDEATGLLNRKGLEARVQQALSGAVTMGSSHALCVLELDLLSAIVSKCGEQVASELLRNFVPVLENHILARGVAARLKAGRFAVLLHRCAADTAKAVMEVLRADMETSQCKWHAERFPLTISVGLVPIDAHSGSVSAVFEAADRAYAQARAAGGNRVEVYEIPGSASEDRVTSASMISSVLANGRLTLRCQLVTPIGAEAQARAHYELLLGVKNERGDIVLPGQFLQAAERDGMMLEVDLWVIRTALRWMADNPAKVDAVDGYSINVSGLTLANENLVDTMREIFADARVPPDKIVFEVTESSTIESLPIAVNFIHAMKEYGCRFSLDKFGSGEASLTHLEALPIDYVKIDGSLVRDIAADPRDLMLVRSLNEIGHFLGRRTVAECVESREVLTRLRQIGVDYAQGFGIERPFLLQ